MVWVWQTIPPPARSSPNAGLWHVEKAPHQAQERGHRKEHPSRVRFGSCTMSVPVRNAWINKIPGVWVLERYLEVKTSCEVEISQDAKEWHHASTTTQSSQARYITASLPVICISQPSGTGIVEILSLAMGTMRLSYRIAGRLTTSWLCKLTIRLPAVPHHDMVIVVNTGNIDADHHVGTPMSNLCA